MRKFYIVMIAVLLLTSCVRSFEIKEPNPALGSGIPNDFNWEMVQDVAVAVAAPTVNGTAVSANIRLYCSPLLTDEYLIAKGVASASARFSTSVALPLEATDLYVKTTLPDGSSSVRSVAVTKTINLPGTVMVPYTASPMGKLASATRAKELSAFDELDIPQIPELDPTQFDAQAILVAGQKYPLGDNPAYATQNYLIPAGTAINGDVTFDGSYNGPRRTLYVAGKLTLSSASIARVTLAVLDGGEVTIGSVTTNTANNQQGIYVFKGGSFKATSVNFSSKIIVNKGLFEVTEALNANSGGMKLYNYAGATMKLSKAEFTNSTEFHNDGLLEIQDVEGNSSAALYNWANGKLDVDTYISQNSSMELWQRGVAHFDEFKMTGGGKIYFLCYTTIGAFSGDNGAIEIASGVGVDVEALDFNSSVKMNLASGAILRVELFKAGGSDFTSLAKKNSAETAAVILITEKAECAEWGTRFKGGPLEVVYAKAELPKKCFQNGSDAYQTKKQETVIAPTHCNGGKAPIVPDPDPLPTDDYSMQPGMTFTYCFEDNWPWLGDYDMNDVAMHVRIDRERSKSGALVKSIVINWSLIAAGNANQVGCAMQLDKLLSSEIAAVVSTYSIASGNYFSANLEANSEVAIVPLFNLTTALLNSKNTFKTLPYAQPAAHTTTITFKQPMEVTKVDEGVMNLFIVVNERAKEVHLPGFQPTAFGDVTRGFALPNSPYKFYLDKGEAIVNNNMMWGLKIPGDFRYPAELNDIRDVYKNFKPWALSGGTSHQDWYKTEADQSKVY